MELEQIFPRELRGVFPENRWQEGLEEIRVRIGRPLEFCYGDCIRYLKKDETSSCGWSFTNSGGNETGRYKMTLQTVTEMLNYISNYSLYSYQEELKQGYLTIEGGHRIGIAGQVTIQNDKVNGIYPITYLNIRVAHEQKNCASRLIPYLRCENSLYNTLLLSEPGGGKTTFLRDIIRLLSMGNEKNQGLKISVVDERSELAACYQGVPQNDMGPRTDILDGCRKAEGMLMLLRAMSPQVIAVDELGAKEDFEAVEQILFSGSRILGTIHAGNVKELREKPYLGHWMDQKMFQRLIEIHRGADGSRMWLIYNECGERIDGDCLE